ncbi:hypothetical protein Vadar_013547 [Vaccinium darrowii]|uniref:Uncharacterized protein n=1 Tax=Vaccinium darrowii TaxID=229202 RepID=A0ACB7YDA9_9ERIC|nr:hypothetical protein Vadar_013547 [Vaccinium darrowii]
MFQPNPIVFMHSQVASTHIVSGNMENPDDRRNLLASRVKARLEGHGAASTCSSVASSKHIFPLSQMIPPLTSSQDTSSVTLKVFGLGKIIRFQFPLTSGIKELKEEVGMRLNLRQGSFNITYEDDAGDKILIPIDTDLRIYLTGFTSSVNPVIKLWIQYPIP